MKITCQSCQSKYNVADEKVEGKIVKIRCRKCGATIVVNGTGGAATNGTAGADTTAQTGAMVNMAPGQIQPQSRRGFCPLRIKIKQAIQPARALFQRA